MPERNLVFNRLLNSLTLIVIALTLVASQVGCTKLGNASLDNEFITFDQDRPSFNTEPATELESPTNPTRRFLNDPQKALEELNEASGNLSENLDQGIENTLDALVAEKEAGARIVDISNQFKTEPQVKLTATPPAPVISSSELPMSFEPINRTSFEHSDLRPTGNQFDLRTARGEKPPINLASLDTSAEACAHDGCDCMKPKLEPKLPFAQPIAPPISTFAPPSELVSQPLSPILFDEETRQIGQTSDSQMRNNTLRRVAPTLEKPVSKVWKQPFDATISKVKTPLVDSSAFKPSAPIVLSSNKSNARFKAKTKFESDAACAFCESFDCERNCNLTSRETRMNTLQPIIASEEIVPEKVVIVATMTDETVPPFAEPPAMDIVESTPELVRVIAEPKQFTSREVVGNFAPVKREIERIKFDDLTESDLTAMFGPPSVPEQIHVPKPCPNCLSIQCVDANCGIKKAPLANDFNFAPMINAEIKVDPPQELPEFQAAPIEVADSNQFRPNGFIPSEQNDPEPAQWVAPTANFSPVSTEPILIPMPNEKGDGSDSDSNYDQPDGMFPIVDTSIPPEPEELVVLEPEAATPPEPEVIIEVIDNTVPWSEKLAETIENVKTQLQTELDPMSRNGLEVNLRLLEVLQRQMIDVEENKSGLSNVEREYWQHQLDAINVMLPSNESTLPSDLDRHQTAHETLDHLRKAVERLERIANLKVANGYFCTKISGFGKFQPMLTKTFKSGQRTLVYCEIENYLSQQQTQSFQTSFHTRLRGSYVIYDEQGRAVQQAEYPVVEDVSRKRRRDFYMYFPIQIGELPTGKYRLDLLVEDLGGNKSASLSPGMNFRVE